MKKAKQLVLLSQRTKHNYNPSKMENVEQQVMFAQLTNTSVFEVENNNNKINKKLCT